MMYLNKPKIPILGIHEFECLYKYFKGVEQLISKRFALNFVPNEEHLTSIFCELLDEKGAQLHSLPYSIIDLNHDLSTCGSLLHADIAIKTSDYNKYQEFQATKADLGIVIEYQDHVKPNSSFRTGVLLQAKKLFTDAYNHYSLHSKYESFNVKQHNDISKLNKYFIEKKCGTECIKYILYNPPLEIFSHKEQQQVRYNQQKADANLIQEDDNYKVISRYTEIVNKIF